MGVVVLMEGDLKQIKPAIVVAGYSRPACVHRLLNSVCDAYYPINDITLIISLDYSNRSEENVEISEKCAWRYGEKKIIRHNKRKGLKEHILSCGDMSEEYGAVIVLEDDLLVSPDYYSYVLQMLDYYKNDDRICGISLYSHDWNGYGNYQFMPQRNEYDVFIGQIGISWGQCWTQKQWRSFKSFYNNNKDKAIFDEKLPWTINLWGEQSWAKYFYDYMVNEDKYYVIPYISLSTNFSDEGEHNSKVSNTFQVMIMEARGKKYYAPTFEQAIKYDMFFERILDDTIKVGNVLGNDICVNLNGFRRSVSGKKYILTCKRYDGINPEAHFGLRMRPIEQNVLLNIPGDDIYLYKSADIQGKDISNYRRTSRRRIEYEIYGNPLRRLEDYVDLHCFNTSEKGTNIIKSAWDMTYEYGRVQKRIERSMNEYRSTGETWMLHDVPEMIEGECEYSITRKTFKKLVEQSLKESYSFSAIKDIFDIKNDKSVFLTFDDGYEGVYKNVLQICEEMGIPFCIFITIGFLNRENYISRKELIELSKCKLCTIGSHTMTHPMLRYLSEDKIKYELSESKQVLEEIIDKEVEFLAYPYGSVFAVDDRSIELAEKVGYKMAFTTLAAHNTCLDGTRFFLPRKNINEKIAEGILKVNMD